MIDTATNHVNLITPENKINFRIEKNVCKDS